MLILKIPCATFSHSFRLRNVNRCSKQSSFKWLHSLMIDNLQWNSNNKRVSLLSFISFGNTFGNTFITSKTIQSIVNKQILLTNFHVHTMRNQELLVTTFLFSFCIKSKQCRNYWSTGSYSLNSLKRQIDEHCAHSSFSHKIQTQIISYHSHMQKLSQKFD